MVTMTKQDALREGILKVQRCEDDSDCPEDYEGGDPCPECRTEELIKYLHDNDVVIKVEREPPSITPKEYPVLTEAVTAQKVQKDMLKAGYTATEPLI